MKHDLKDGDYTIYRTKYITCLLTNIFPWESAYYYYVQNIDTIKIKSFNDFQDDILTEASLCESTADNWNKISGPMYDALEMYYAPIVLSSKDDKVIKMY